MVENQYNEENEEIKITKKILERVKEINKMVTTYPILISSNRFEETLKEFGFSILCAFSDEQVTSESFISTLKEFVKDETKKSENLRVSILSYGNHVYKKIIQYGLYRFFYDNCVEIVEFDDACYADKIEDLDVDLIILILLNGIYITKLNDDELRSIAT